MKQIIIITGHNNFASGILSSLTMIAGSKDNIYAVDFLIKIKRYYLSVI